MSTTPSLPEQAMLRATGYARPKDPFTGVTDGIPTPEELRVEDTIIDVPEDLDDPERAAVVHDASRDIAEHLDRASEFDVSEQLIPIPDEDDERV